MTSTAPAPSSLRPLWQRAASFAADAHRAATRRDGRTPYIAHPVRVALTVTCLFGVQDEEILAAALLHDTIEDTGVDYDDLLERFGRRVADIVAALSKDMRLIEAEREPAYDRQLERGPWEARLIKLADVFDNLSETSGSPRAILERARRALLLTRDEEALGRARAIVLDLMSRIEGMPPGEPGT
jgi:(p)ppGpp synthase/HD superfamily hydrolase